MKIKIYTDCPLQLYYEGIYHLNKNTEMIGTRFLYYSMIKLNNNFKIFRKLRKLIKGEEKIIKNEPVSKIFKSLIAPFKLLFTKDIVVSIVPCSNKIYYLYLLKLLRKNLIFYSSWPYYGEKYVKKPRLWNWFLWKLFFKNVKAVGINKKATEGMKTFGARAVNIPHSVDTSLFKPEEKNNNELVVLYVGRLNEAKGIRSILKLAEKFKEIKFVFVGSGPLENEVRESNVKFLGEIKDREKLSKVYKNSDIFILNSYKTNEWEEIFGRVIIEAMASGLGVIATDCMGPKEIINEKNGILIEQKNDNQLLEKFELLVKDNELRKRLGKQARKDAVDKYDINKVAEKWLEILQK
jgi:glycosyltransferase involved in cell wall biosynthesis